MIVVAFHLLLIPFNILFDQHLLSTSAPRGQPQGLTLLRSLTAVICIFGGASEQRPNPALRLHAFGRQPSAISCRAGQRASA